MLPILVGVAPLVVGMFVILVLARYAPNVPQAPSLATGGALDQRPEITSDEFKDVVEDLVEALGLHTVFSSQGTGGVVEMTLRDTRPLSGGRILLFASPTLHERINSVEALGFAEGVRGDMGALKGIMISLAGFTDEARASIGASPAPVDLIDGGELLELVRDHVSTDRAAIVGEYRGFGSDRSPRAT